LIESNADQENSCCDKNIFLRFPSNEAQQKERIKSWSTKNKNEQDMCVPCKGRAMLSRETGLAAEAYGSAQEQSIRANPSC
jgi:hypothetical protein